MNNITDQTNKNQLIDAFNNVVSDAEALLIATANTGGEKFSEVRAKAEASLSVAKEKLLEAHDDLIVKAKEVTAATDDYVHDNPWRSIGMVATAGIIIGLLVGRR